MAPLASPLIFLSVLLLALVQTTYATQDQPAEVEPADGARAQPVSKEQQPASEQPATSDSPSGAHSQPVISEKQREAQKILSNPPPAFNKFLSAVPFSIYGKDKRGNYVAFCNSQGIHWSTVSKLKQQDISEYLKYLGLFFWMNVDKREDSSLTVVVDASGFSFSKVMDGSVKLVLRAIISGLNDTVPFVGQRRGRVILTNVPTFMKPLISVLSKVVRNEVDLLVFSNRAEAELKEHIGESQLPAVYGGKNPTKPEDSPVMKYMKQSVSNILKQNKAAAANKA